MMDADRSSQISDDVMELETKRVLFKAAITGNKRRAKKILKAGFNVNAKNSSGQTPLFCACYEGQESLMDLFLKYGADPNERSRDGATSVHAAAHCGSLRMMERLLESGGDLRLHDNDMKTPRDWALMQGDSKKRRRMIEYLEQARWFTMTTVGGVEEINTTITRKPQRSISLKDIFRSKATTPTKVQNLGFGQIYTNNNNVELPSAASALPIVNEVELVHDDLALTFNSGPFMVIEGMFWNNTKISAKRLHRNPLEGGCVDLLINEHDNMIKLKHANLLLLLGICQINNLEGLILLYEPIRLGSLYYYMHERLETINSTEVKRIAEQMCGALIFLHERNVLHCNVTSHAVQLVTPHTAKLGNLHYAVNRPSSDEPVRLSHVVHNTYMNAAYNWMAPELMDGRPPSQSADLYSFCALLWEMFTGEIPWGGMNVDDIYTQLIGSGQSLPVDQDSIPMPYTTILEYGLVVYPEERNMTLTSIQQAFLSCHLNSLEHDRGDIPRAHAVSVSSPQAMKSVWSDKTHRRQQPPYTPNCGEQCSHTPVNKRSVSSKNKSRYASSPARADIIADSDHVDQSTIPTAEHPEYTSYTDDEGYNEDHKMSSYQEIHAVQVANHARIRDLDHESSHVCSRDVDSSLDRSRYPADKVDGSGGHHVNGSGGMEGRVGAGIDDDDEPSSYTRPYYRSKDTQPSSTDFDSFPPTLCNNVMVETTTNLRRHLPALTETSPDPIPLPRARNIKRSESTRISSTRDPKRFESTRDYKRSESRRDFKRSESTRDFKRSESTRDPKPDLLGKGRDLECVHESTSTEDGRYDFIKDTNRRNFFRSTWPRRPISIVSVSTTTTNTQPEDTSTTTTDNSDDDVSVVVGPAKHRAGFSYLKPPSSIFGDKLHQVTHKKTVSSMKTSQRNVRPSVVRQISTFLENETENHADTNHRESKKTNNVDTDTIVSAATKADREVEAHAVLEMYDRKDAQYPEYVNYIHADNNTIPSLEAVSACLDSNTMTSFDEVLTSQPRDDYTTSLARKRSGNSPSVPYSSLDGYKPVTHQTERVTLTEPVPDCFSVASRSTSTTSNRTTATTVHEEGSKQRMKVAFHEHPAHLRTPDKEWFAGKGSVRNLIHLFDYDKTERPSEFVYQAVLAQRTPLRPRMPQWFHETTDTAVMTDHSPPSGHMDTTAGYTHVDQATSMTEMEMLKSLMMDDNVVVTDINRDRADERMSVKMTNYEAPQPSDKGNGVLDEPTSSESASSAPSNQSFKADAHSSQSNQKKNKNKTGDGKIGTNAQSVVKSKNQDNKGKRDWRRAGKNRSKKVQKELEEGKMIPQCKKVTVVSPEEEGGGAIVEREQQHTGNDISPVVSTTSTSTFQSATSNLQPSDMEPSDSHTNISTHGDEQMNGTQTFILNKSDIEDIYIDDVIHPNMLEDRHMRLQTTIALDGHLNMRLSRKKDASQTEDQDIQSQEEDESSAFGFTCSTPRFHPEFQNEMFLEDSSQLPAADDDFLTLDGMH